MRRSSVGLVATIIALWFCTSARAAENRPNLIVIVTDDQAMWSVGAYGNRESRTPNMDRLAREGARFTNAFTATPVCSPSRAAFLTGRYGTELGITDWITVAQAEAGVGLPPETVTWPEVLKQNGYTTALVGKWHLGHLPQHHPTRHGYDHFWGIIGGGAQAMDPQVEVDGQRTKLKGPTPDLTTDEALRWLESNKDKPFAMSIHFREPHLPYAPVREEDSAPFMELDPTIPDFKGLDPQWTKDTYRKYYASVHSVDRNIGRLLARLDELKLAENTIVLFTSDHGYNIGHHGIYTKGNGSWILAGTRGPKRPNMFEESIRVPLIVRGPGVAVPGTTIDAPVSNIDTSASVLGMVGLKPPADAKQHGLDFSPFLRGEQPVDWRKEVFGQYDLHNAGLAYMRMVRTDEWKLVRHHVASGLNELYDLKNDLGETKNLYHDAKARAARDDLQTRLTAWQLSIDDPILKLDARPIEPGPNQ
ncbi:MAG: sulfatase-like hydrolase/transferase [Tepidisphaeraceae bacterium]